MEVSSGFCQQFYHRVQRVLHVPGNFTGPVLEMSVVLDHHVPPAGMEACVPALLGSLKRRSEVFRNVRFHIVDWLDDERIINRTVPMMTVLVNGCFREYEPKPDEKRIECLYQNLKFYHARSKLILLFTDGVYTMRDQDAAAAALKPFLGRKLLTITMTKDGPELR